MLECGGVKFVGKAVFGENLRKSGTKAYPGRLSKTAHKYLYLV